MFRLTRMTQISKPRLKRSWIASTLAQCRDRKDLLARLVQRAIQALRELPARLAQQSLARQARAARRAQLARSSQLDQPAPLAQLVLDQPDMQALPLGLQALQDRLERLVQQDRLARLAPLASRQAASSRH